MDEVTQAELSKHFCAVVSCEELATHRVVIKVDHSPHAKLRGIVDSSQQLVLEPDLRVCGGRECWAFVRQSLHVNWVQSAVEEAMGHAVQPITADRLHHEFAPLLTDGTLQA